MFPRRWPRNSDGAKAVAWGPAFAPLNTGADAPAFNPVERMPVMKKLFIVAAATCALSGAVAAGTQQPYAGQDQREIASLSQTDIQALLAGQGWGLAKPAELNGYPGPAHVLELAEELSLTAEQSGAIKAIFAEMQTEAQRLGAEYVAAERHLSGMFRMGHATPEMLDRQLAQSGEILARLRAIHLKAHLETRPLLSADQIATYVDLRGYGHGGNGAHQGHAGGGHNHD